MNRKTTAYFLLALFVLAFVVPVSAIDLGRFRKLQVALIQNEIGLTIRGVSGQSANLIECQDSTGTAVFSVSAAGAVGMAAGTALSVDAVTMGSATDDCGIAREAASTVKITNGSTGYGNVQVSADVIFEGTANTSEAIIRATDPTSDTIWTIPVAAAGTYSLMSSTLATNAPDVVNSVTGGTNQLVFEGATANDFETTVAPADPTADRAVTIPDQSGIVMISSAPANMTADDVTPSMIGSRVWASVANSAGAHALTDLDDPVVGETYMIILGDTTNPISIADGGAVFILTGNWTPDSVGDNIVLYVAADNLYYEVSRSDT
jgi:hypothetical protein